MKAFLYLTFGILLFGLSGCIEIIDDLTLNEDGSGTFKYNVNLSASKAKVNSILALDSLDGRKVPSLDEIKNRIESISQKLREQPGITHVEVDSNLDDYIIKISCDFNSLNALQVAIKNIVKEETKKTELNELDHQWVSFQNGVMKRSIPQITIRQSKQINQSDQELLKNGTYTSITRFNKEIDSFENQNAMLSKNKKAILLRTDPYTLTHNPNLLDNTIRLSSGR